MPNFDNADAESQAARDANNLLAHVRGLYQSCKAAQDLLARYQGGQDATFTASVNALFNASERAEFVAMSAQINALVSDWETNHRAALGLPPAAAGRKLKAES